MGESHDASKASDERRAPTMSKTKVSVDVRVDATDKASWQAEADAACVSVSELVRQRMSETGAVAVATPAKATPVAPEPPALTPGVRVNLDAAELASLRGWLDLADSDGEIDPVQLAEWKAFAADSGITFPELLTRLVVYRNVAYL
jgi:hypothetical protein